MKKWLLVLGMIICMMGLTACGAGDKEEKTYYPDASARELVDGTVMTLSQIVNTQSEESVIFSVEQNGGDGAMYSSALESWKNAVEEMGRFIEVTGITENTVEAMSMNGTYYPTEGILEARLKGETHDALLQIMVEGGTVTSISTNVIYSFGENMKKAGLNTLLGMGTVFCVLILISLIISAFGLIPKVQAKFNKKNKVTETKTTAMNNTIAQIVEKEELSDDLELAAVIAAAIAASEDAASTDGFVVRSIRRAGNKWQSAGRAGV